MKLDTSRHGFSRQKSTRKRDRKQAEIQLNEILESENITPNRLLDFSQFDALFNYAYWNQYEPEEENEQ